MNFDKALDKFDARAKASKASAAAKKQSESAAAAAAAATAAQQSALRTEKAHESSCRLAVRRVYARHASRTSPYGCPPYSASLRAVPVHGDGDKITLPQSALEQVQAAFQDERNLPLTFRVAVPNPSAGDGGGGDDDERTTSSFAELYSAAREAAAGRAPSLSRSPSQPDSSSDGEDGEADKDSLFDSYLLSRRRSELYLSFCHSGVLEFSAAEGTVGLPARVCASLLSRLPPSASHLVPAPPPEAATPSVPMDTDGVDAADLDPFKVRYEDEGPNTAPGQPAYGLFATPVSNIKISLVRLPKGSSLVLVPTVSAYRAGFASLVDVKRTLEQSLAATRTTLSEGDRVSVWQRGVEFELVVKEVEPDYAKGVCIIDTNVEVEIGRNEEMEEWDKKEKEEAKAKAKAERGAESASPAVKSVSLPFSGQGFSLNSPSSTSLPPPPSSLLQPSPFSLLSSHLLPPEPEKGCTVQIKGASGTYRRRFDAKSSTVKDLYAFAKSSTGGDAVDGHFVLVSRMPRAVYERERDGDKTLGECGFGEFDNVALFLEEARGEAGGSK